MRHYWLVASLATTCATLPAGAAEAPHNWSGNHAFVIPAHRVELGLFQNSHYGLGHGLELSLHPLWMFALPHVELKQQLGSFGPGSAWAVQGRLGYPTLFLGLVSRAGAGGLLPKTSDPPQALQIEADWIGTLAFAQGRHEGSLAVGIALAPHSSFTERELPLLDFPFAYPRFAALYTWGVPRGSLNFEGPLWRDKLYYEASVKYYLMPSLPDVGTAYALEPAAQLQYRFSERVAASLALRSSVAQYAYGTELHFLPYADVRVGF